MKILVLGTGCGGTRNNYNTCFVIQNEKGNFLIDTGGSIELLNRLEEFKIDFKTLQNIFISHAHIDHVLGLIWYFKAMYGFLKKNTPKDKINIFCNKETYEAIMNVSKNVLQPKIVESIEKYYNFIILNDKDCYTICGINYEFFDIFPKGFKQFGFEFKLNGKKFVFLGDEPVRNENYDRIKNAYFVAHETFCLDAEKDKFHPYEKNHTTVKSSCQLMESLGVKNLILWHTIDNLAEKRKELYIKEAKENYTANIYVPNDLEIIDLDM